MDQLTGDRIDTALERRKTKPWGRVLLHAALLCVMIVSCGKAPEQSSLPGPGALTRWTLLTDYYGEDQSNWRTLAIIHMAMHDALNAARPTYVRWFPPAAGEPSAAGADPEVAMAAAAAEVLTRLHPTRADVTERTFRAALDRAPNGPGTDAAIRLGRAIGAEAVRRREKDGWAATRLFKGGTGPGVWRPVPPTFANSGVSGIRPFLFNAVTDLPGVPPPSITSPKFLADVAESRRVGGALKADRSVAQTNSAIFWARQSPQRGFGRVALTMLPADIFASARIISQLAAAFADSAIIIWSAKERYSFWRPITVIQDPAQAGDKTWIPLLYTPPFPEYPSGHSADCFVGADFLQRTFREASGSVRYISLASQGNLRRPGGTTFGVGQHADTGAGGAFDNIERIFPSLAAAAEDCAESRIWAGAHFRSANEESRRVAGLIVARALAAVPPLAQPAAKDR